MDPVIRLKRPLEVDVGLCIFCQEERTTDTVRDAGEQGIGTVLAAMCKRKKFGDRKYTDVIDRLENVLDVGNRPKLFWHKTCYSYFTDKNKIDRLQHVSTKQSVSQQEENNSPSASSGFTRRLRTDVAPVQWSLCIFCQTEHAGERLISVMTTNMSSDILKNSHLDYIISVRLAGVGDLIAVEGKYHLACLRRFQRSTDKTKNTATDLAMVWLCQELKAGFESSNVYELNDVWERYIVLAEQSSIEVPHSFKSRKSTFKEKIQTELKESFYFYQSTDNHAFGKHTLLIPAHYRCEITIATEPRSPNTSSFSAITPFVPGNDEISLIHVALKIRSEILSTPSIKGLTVSEENAKRCIPEGLNMLLRLIFGGSSLFEDDNDESKSSEDNIRMRVFSIAQDIVYATKGCHFLTPKHIGLASTLHQATRSKDLVEVFHKAGHCASYKQVLKVDTALAESTLKSIDPASGAVIPPNLLKNVFTHFTADNIDILDETLDGKNTFHATQMAAWQRGTNPDDLLDHLKPSSKTTLNVPSLLGELCTISIKRDKLRETFASEVQKDWFQQPTDEPECGNYARTTDLAFALHRHYLSQKPGWTEFNQSLPTKELELTSVGYLPIILAPAHEIDTLNTVVKRCMAISQHLQQQYTVITVDQALFPKLMELKWTVPEYQDRLIPRLGGLHISMNFLKTIGDHMHDCGLVEVWLESGLLGQGAIALSLAGKAYNKAMRAHKLTYQALWSLLLPSFLQFTEEHDSELHRQIMQHIKKTEASDPMLLISTLKDNGCCSILTLFVKERSETNVNFAFWWQYMEMIETLLMFTRALREGNWHLHLYAFSRMLPYFMRYDHYNYARWGTVYLASMHQLPTSVLSEFEKGNFVVKRSKRRFNQVDGDHAQEWVNGTGKKGGGIVGITKTVSALSRWALSYNLRSKISAQTHAMFHCYPGGSDLHSDCTPARRKRDNDDESSLTSILNKNNVFSSQQRAELFQIATKDIATASVAFSLLHASSLGQNQVDKFVQERLIKNENVSRPEISIYAPLRKNRAETFSTLYSVLKVSKEKEKNKVLKADRNVIQRLLLAYESGRPVNMPDILKHELMPVPLALAEMNGSLRTGNKSILAEILKEGIHCPDTIEIDKKSSCLIIDGQALVMSIGRPTNSLTFGDLADTFIHSVLQSGSRYQRVDIVFDRYLEESIKGNTRARRTAASTRPIRRVIEGREVPLPKNWMGFIALPDNKADLARFLSEELISKAPSSVEIVVAGGFTDSLCVRSSSMLSNVSCLKSTHEEADTRMMVHVTESLCETVVVYSRDTDVLLLLLYNFPRVHCKNLWMMTGSSNKRQYVPIRAVFHNLPPDSYEALLPFHALTGCDTTSYIAGHTKKSAWKVFIKHHHLLTDIGEEELDEQTIISAEKFICRTYKVENTDSIDSARHICFSKMQSPELLPPTSDSFLFHLMRVHYQSSIWKSSHCAIPVLATPTSMGWERSKNGLSPILMSLDPIPTACLEVISCACSKQCINMRCKCRKAKLQCTSLCKCDKNSETHSICMNIT